MGMNRAAVRALGFEGAIDMALGLQRDKERLERENRELRKKLAAEQVVSAKGEEQVAAEKRATGKVRRQLAAEKRITMKLQNKLAARDAASAKPAKNSRNSSIPPSKDRKANRPEASK
ncbi:MAG: hypothetical protein FWD68_16505, partial [Alphaproteobacteria bacterium]|nr:hypothetical protein [Alphaproteobacteria bacterium]